MIKISAKTQVILVDTLLTGLLTGLILLAFFPFLRETMPTFPVHFVLTILAALCVNLLTRKKYILPVSFLTIFLALLFISFRVSLSQYITEIQSLWRDSSDIDTMSLVDNSFLFLIALGLSFPLFLMFRKLFSFFVPLVLGGISIVRLYFSGSEHFYLALIVLLFIIFVTLAKSRGKAHAKLLSEKIEPSRAYHSITAILMLVIVLLSTYFVAPKEDGQWQSDLLVKVSRDVSSLLRLDGSTRPMDGIFDIRTTGYQPTGHRMGGDVIPDYTVVMNVHTSTPTMLVGSYYDTYDGQRWYNAHGHTIFRYDALILREERNRVFLDRLPVGGSEAQMLYDRLLTEGEFRIYSSILGRSVFHAGHVESIYDADFDTDLLSFNEHGELFLDGSVQRGMNYKMDTAFIDRSRPRFDENVIALEQLAEDQRDPYYDQITEYYTHLPETLPQNVYDLAFELTDEDRSPYQNARTIENWLADNCEYTLTPGTPPEDEDFVNYFLETRQGYCVYYASAMTVLARCIGLPARYVSGFSLSRSPFDTNYTRFLATNASAHVWTEIYFEGIGWIPFDASGRSGDSAYTIDLDIIDEDYIRPILSPSPTPIFTVTPETEDIDSQINNDIRFHAPILIITFLFISGLILIAYSRTTYLIKDNRIFRKIHLSSKSSNDKKLLHLYNRSVKQLNLIGIPMAPSETINEYLSRLHNKTLAQTLTDSWQSVILLKYADIQPLNEDIEQLYTLSRDLEKQLLKQKGVLRYAIYRIFHFY